MAAIWTLFDILWHISGLENGGKFIFVSISMFYGSMIPIKAILEVFTNVYTSNLHIICINYLKIGAILVLYDIIMANLMIGKGWKVYLCVYIHVLCIRQLGSNNIRNIYLCFLI